MIKNRLDEIVRLDVVDSTNDAAKRMLEERLPEKGVLFMAEQQVKGRGRLGREWKTSFGKNIMMSLLRETRLPAEKISAITLLAGVAVADMIVEELKRQGDASEVSIKWPNDIVINKKKVCGILTELCVHNGNYVIAGIGINVNEETYPEELSDKATSLLIETGRLWDRASLAEGVVNRLLNLMDEYEETGSLEFIRERYNAHLVNINNEVYIESQSSDGQRTEKVISRGIDDTGALLVEDSEGNIKQMISGEVSVRGLYGYV